MQNEMAVTAPAVTVRVEYFAVMYERRGKKIETVVTRCRTAEELYRELDRLHEFGADIRTLKVAVDDEVVAWDTELTAGAKVIFLPPFSGG